MAHTYMLFDFGADEDKVQQARHKLESWKQALRLDKKLQFKFDRGESAGSETPETPQESPGKTVKSEKKGKHKSKAKHKDSDSEATNGDVKLLVRLYFSAHEKLSEQKLLDRFNSEELFKDATPRVVHEGETEFPEVLAQFDRLD